MNNLASQTDVGERGDGAGRDQDASLDQTLLLLNRVVHAAVTSIVVSDPNQPDNPIVFHNPAFEKVSGYAASEIDGFNCRFLQGADTDPATIATLRRAIAAEQPCNVVILNYRKNGTAFWNDLSVSPVRNENGDVTHFVGVQSDVTNRIEAEQERNALLEQQQRIAELLQRALLLNPPATSLIGVEISTQYLPASDEAKIGGDFFDTVALSPSRVALVVGDYVGKGLEAAQYTAEVKYALRVLLREYGEPTVALDRLNTFLLDSQRLNARADVALVCISVAVMDTQTGAVSLACGGMEPPLVVRSGGAMRCPRPRARTWSPGSASIRSTPVRS
ncbi:MAG: PAS domain-containing protein, partial [Armatimonadetes bacterium]|nr:PAS domain-containing protein [Armatimonadota bacterium]